MYSYNSQPASRTTAQYFINHEAFRDMEEKAILDISDLRCTETDSACRDDKMLDGLLGSGPNYNGRTRRAYLRFSRCIFYFSKRVDRKFHTLYMNSNIIL